jgi:ribosomal protein S18 acetylase RimI-like enzyme
MQGLEQAIWREAPRCVGLTMAELAYQVGISASSSVDNSTYRLWMQGSECLAWGWHFPPASLEWAVHPRAPGLLDSVLDWFDEEATVEFALTTSAREGDKAARLLLRKRGFVEDPQQAWMRLNHRTLGDIKKPQLPTGYRIRTVADYGGDITKRVAVHQRSWADLGTQVALDTYPGVMATWPYRSDLDFVLEADDGTPAAFALGWYDDANGLGEFEPLGTDPEYRQRGLGRALLLFGLKRFRDLGATAAVVGSRGDKDHPLPSLLYESAGFREFSRQVPYVRHDT